MAAGKKKTTKKPTAAKPAKKTAGKPQAAPSNQGELGFGAPVRPVKSEAKAPAPKAAPAPEAAAPPPPAAKGERAPSFSPVARRIRSESNIIRQKILQGEKPAMKFPLRALANVNYSSGTGYFEIKGKSKERTLTVNTVKTFAQTLRMMALSKELVDTDDIATKREAYYVSKNWDEARFKEQPESDTVMEDVEALFGVNREQLGFIPEEKGGDVAGQLVVIDHDRDTGEKLRIDCTKFGSGAYSIPISVEHLRFETEAKFILVHRDRRHVPAAGQAQLLEERQLHPDLHGGRAHPRLPPLHSAAGRQQRPAGLRVRRRRPLRLHATSTAP